MSGLNSNSKYLLFKNLSIKNNMLSYSAVCALMLSTSINGSCAQGLDKQSILNEKSYTKIENDQRIDIFLEDMQLKLQINNFVKEINNNHSYKISIFSYEKDGKPLIVPFENSNHLTEDFLSSSIYEQCRGKSTFFRVKDGSLYVLQIETPYDHKEESHAILRKLEKNDDLAGDTLIEFSFVQDFYYRRTCKD